MSISAKLINNIVNYDTTLGRKFFELCKINELTCAYIKNAGVYN